MGEFQRGTDFANAALHGLSNVQASQWARKQAYRIGLSFGGDFNRAIKNVLSDRGLWPDDQQTCQPTSTPGGAR